METGYLDTELVFSTSRSGGAGGQHVNKTETKVELRFNIDKSQILSEDEKQLLKTRLKARLTNDSELLVVSQRHRSQYKNKQDCIERFYELVAANLKKEKIRKKLRPSKKWHENRLKRKQENAEKKDRRRNIF